jgi:hypothetical protein
MISVVFLGKVRLTLPIERFLGIGGMYGVVEQARGKIAPYGAGDGLPGLCGAYDPPNERHCVPALQNNPDARTAADERDEVPEERLVLVDNVELRALDLADGLHPDLDRLQAALLEPADYLAYESSSGSVGLDHDEGALHRWDGGQLGVVPGPLELARVALQLTVVELAL